MAFVHGMNVIARSKRRKSAALLSWARCKRLRKREEGAAIVEMALMLPILMMVMMGIFILGVIFNNQIMLTYAVGNGAQYLVAQASGITADPCTATTAYIQGYTPNLVAANINITYTLGSSGTPETSCTLATLQGLAQGQPVTVSATYPCNFTIFGLNVTAANVSAGNPTGCQLSASNTLDILTPST